MQKLLRDILNDPPYNLARLANLLLMVCIILLGTVFLFRTIEKDITLNLSLASEEEVMVEGENQLSKFTWDKLYPIAKVGQDLNRGDTLLMGISNEQFSEMKQWIEELNEGNLIPTKEMLDKYSLPKEIHKRMLELAQAAFNKPSGGKLSTENKDRIIKVKELIAQLEQEVVDLNAAIPKFEALAKNKEAKFFNERERHAAGEIELSQLKKEKEKWDEAVRDIKIRTNQLRTAKGELFEYQSELSFLTKSISKPKKKNKLDLLPFEQDLKNSLNAYIKSQLVFSDYNGTIYSFGKLDNIQTQDTLVFLEGRMEKANRSHTIIADANTIDAKHISVNAVSNIILKDGSNVIGTIKGFEDREQGEDSVIRINAEEEVSYADIEQIIVPATNTNFMDKVLENF